MAKGGFLAEMLASRNATSDSKYLWHYLYYIYIGIPLLFTYWGIYLYVWYTIVGMLYKALGLEKLRTPWLHTLLTVALSLGFTTALYHYKVLPYLFVPVKMITSV